MNIRTVGSLTAPSLRPGTAPESAERVAFEADPEPEWRPPDRRTLAAAVRGEVPRYPGDLRPVGVPYVRLNFRW